MLHSEKQIEEKKKIDKIESILNHQVEGEAFILTPSREWKQIVLKHFNQVHRGELGIKELLTILKEKGVRFSQKDSLVEYPVK
ncbi:hypothetical protein [Bacillus alkalicellulosilyticus]|uniref:hypothetical protein n=1 Tax=Alkalihalobacterium alkalicellulosilyticum TaxID=1912214 RepID=UPI0009964D2F|nr:hypothetical protein [Bacillus alkalicellulosilyticus]